MLIKPARFVHAAVFAALIFVPALAQEVPSEEALKLLPERVADFRGQAASSQLPVVVNPLTPQDFSVVSNGSREYSAPNGERYSVFLVKTDSAPDAYSLLTYRFTGKALPVRFTAAEGLGVVVAAGDAYVKFAKGPSVIHVSAASPSAERPGAVLAFARKLAKTVEGDPAETPVLLQHLPEWPSVEGTYATNLSVLKSVVAQPVLDAVSFEGGAEAVTAQYGDGQVVIVEFTTPQYSIDNDARITQRINELRAAGEPVPSGYRRVGNYSVFVFGAPDEQRAAGLLDRVKYEKDVRWLGDNPHRAELAERFYTMTMTGIIVTTLKATGLAILICLGVGGLFGGVIFLRRRARRTAAEAYADAGGMLNLNVDNVEGARPKFLDEGGKG